MIEKKKKNLVYEYYLQTGRVWTNFEGYCVDFTDGTPPENPMTEAQVMTIAARKPPGPPRDVPWREDVKERRLREKSEAAHKRFLRDGAEKFFGVAPSAKAVMAKITQKQAGAKAFQPFKGLSRPAMREKEKRWRDAARVAKRIVGEGDAEEFGS